MDHGRVQRSSAASAAPDDDRVVERADSAAPANLHRAIAAARATVGPSAAAGRVRRSAAATPPESNPTAPVRVQRSATGANVIRRVINDETDGLSVHEATLDTLDAEVNHGYEGTPIKDELASDYYGEGSTDIDLEDLEDALWEVGELEYMWSDVDMGEVVGELRRLHNNAPDTEARRAELAVAAEAAAEAAAEERRKATEAERERERKAKREAEQASKYKRRNDVLGVMADYVGTRDTRLATIVTKGLESSTGIDKTLSSGLTMSAADLKTLRNAWFSLGSAASGVTHNGVSLSGVTMWCPGKNADVGKKKVRGSVIDHNVNFMFKIVFAEGGSAEFNIHVDVAREDWLD